MIIWITDPHLNFVKPAQIKEFGQQIAEENPSAVLISGDIGEFKNFNYCLYILTEQYSAPTYFVLGNHDCYGGSKVEAYVKGCTIDFATYLTCKGVIELNKNLALIGHDGWYDGRNGDYFGSRVEINDNELISDLKSISPQERLVKIQEWTDVAADKLEKDLFKALSAGYAEIYCLTHVPPCREAGWHNGELQNSQWAPFFSNAVVAARLVKVARNFPEQHVICFTGHTHSKGFCRCSHNVEVYSGAAKYYSPSFVKIPE